MEIKIDCEMDQSKKVITIKDNDYIFILCINKIGQIINFYSYKNKKRIYVSNLMPYYVMYDSITKTYEEYEILFNKKIFEEVKEYVDRLSRIKRFRDLNDPNFELSLKILTELFDDFAARMI